MMTVINARKWVMESWKRPQRGYSIFGFNILAGADFAGANGYPEIHGPVYVNIKTAQE